jgi:hypothetical protein
MRVKYLAVSPHVFVGVLREGNPPIIIERGLPADARFIGPPLLGLGEILLKVESASFEDIPAGERIPTLCPGPQLAWHKTPDPS